MVQRQRDFISAKDRIITALNDSTGIIEEQKDPKIAKQVIMRTFGEVMDICLDSLTYAEAISLLA